MKDNLRDLIEDLATTDQDGTPVIVLVQDYLERAVLARTLTEEAAFFGIELVTLANVKDAGDRLPLMDSSRNQAALIVIDADAATLWGQWLEACREALPDFTRFVIVLMMRRDLPSLAREAPGFMSWAKGLEIPHLVDTAPISIAEVQEDLKRLEDATGLSPKAYVEAWKRGEIPDTHQNTAWLNLALAASGRGSE